MRGRVTAVLRDRRGRIRGRWVTRNLVTANGDQWCALRTHSSPTAMSGMKLGTATTAPAKTGDGSYIGAADYVAGSAHAQEAGWPKAGASNDIAQWRVVWAAGQGTSENINRVTIVDNTTDAGEADGSHTLAIAVFGAAINKGAGDTLTVTWDITFLGA